MKQTNNAIKFLMAQYRAIFKNANIAMVAAMVAATLAAGQAQAAEIQLGTSADKAAESIVVSGSDTGPKTGGFVKNLTIKNGGTLTFDGSATANTGHIKVSNLLSVESGGKIIVKGHTASTNGTGFMGTFVDGDDFSNANSELRVNGGSIEVTKSQIQMSNVNLNNATVTIGTNLGDKNNSDFDDNAQINAVSSDTGGGLFTVTGDKSNITLQSGSILNAAVYDFKKGDINLNGNAASGEYAVIRAFGKGIVNVDGADINASTSGNYIGGKEINVKSGNINVQANGVLHLTGKLDTSKNMDAAQADTTINVTGGKINVAKTGLLTIKGNATFASGTVVNSGTIEAVSGSKINANGNEGLYSKDGQLKLTGGATLNFTGASLDLSDSGSNISGDASSTVLAEKANVTIGNGFEDKVPKLVAGTLTVKGEVSAAPDSSYENRPFLVIQSGDVTALNEVKGSPKNTEIAVYNKKSGGSATLTLGNAQTTNGKLTDIARVYVGVGADGKESTNTLNVNGKWDFGNAKLAVGNNGTLYINEGAEVSNIERLQIHGNKLDVKTKNTVNVNGTLKIKRLLAAESQTTGGDEINVKGTLEILGDGTKETANASGNYANDVQLTKATLNINAGGTVSLVNKDAWDDIIKIESGSTAGVSNLTVVTSGDKTTDFGGWDKTKVNVLAGGTLRLDLSDYTVENATALDKLAAALMSDSSKGLVDFGRVKLAANVDADGDGTIELSEMPKVKTDATKNLEVNLGNTTSLNESYSMGSAKVSGNSLTVSGGSTLEFNNAKNGQFATNKDAAAGADSSVNVTLSANSALNLNGNGSLGDIKKNGTDAGTAVVLGGNNGTQSVGVVDVATFKQVGGNVTTSGPITATTKINVNGVLNAGGHISTATLDLTGGAIKAAGKDITVSGTTSADIFGDVEAGTLSLSGGATIAGNADVKLGTLNLAGSRFLNVGRDGEDGSTATVFTDKLVMGAGSTIFVDPSYNDPATVLATKVLTDTSASDVNVSNGDIMVGKNAAFGIGFDQAEFDSVMSNYLVDGKFTDPVHNQGYANAFVLNTSLKIKSGAGVSVKHDLQDADTVADNSFTLGERAALIITDKAFGTDKTGTAITFGDSTNAVASATVTADASSVISLVGDFDAKDTGLKIFAAVNTGAAGTVNIQSANGIKVQALGGLLEGKLTSGTLDNLDVSDNAKTLAYAGVSRPVGDFLLGLASGDYVVDSTQAGHKFVTSVANTAGGFKVVDTAAHAATYAGAQQAAVASVTTMADAMFGRVGAVGVEAASISATGSQANGGVWLAPMYKSVDADGFNAEGASYGSDVDLGGVAFGADTVNGNMRFGAVFNIGSGDADGKGQGNGLKDEFDYYGFGIYSAMGFGNLALVGDASLSVISHDVEGLGLRGKADTTAVTMGLTGQYTVATPAVDVTPHLGARFIRLNTDSYDLVGADGAIATTDFDVQNVFSVPLGVTLSKAFVAGGWSLAPSADLTVAFNTGDTEAKSTTTFSGIAHGINLNTEVLDEVQYGVTLGLGAQYGAFGTSFGINYTGSENTDSFGVNAQCRYMF